MGLERGHELGWERYSTSALGGFRFGERKTTADSLWARPSVASTPGRAVIAMAVLSASTRVGAAMLPGQPLKLPADGQCSNVKIDVLPLKSKHLALPQSQSQGNAPSSAVPPCSGESEYPQRFIEGQGLEFILAGRWGINESCDVAADVSALQSDLERLKERVCDRLTDDPKLRLLLATYDETIRFNIVLIDDNVGVVQPYLPSVRGVDSPTLVLHRRWQDLGLSPMFEAIYCSLWEKSKPL